MQTLAEGLCAGGVCVVRFEFVYMAKRRDAGTRAPPDRMPALEARFAAVVRSFAADLPLFVGGKSLGGRVAARVADALGARGVIALGYPFHPPRRPDQLRVDMLAALTTRALIVQGTRDPFGTREEVAGYELPAHVALHWLADGDHSFAPRKQSGRTHAQNLDEAVQAALSFIRHVRVGEDRKAHPRRSAKVTGASRAAQPGRAARK
jgi:uncharacterized protein